MTTPDDCSNLAPSSDCQHCYQESVVTTSQNFPEVPELHEILFHKNQIKTCDLSYQSLTRGNMLSHVSSGSLLVKVSKILGTSHFKSQLIA